MTTQLNPFGHIFRTKHNRWSTIKLSSFWRGRVFDTWRLFSGHPTRDEWGLFDYLLGSRFLEMLVKWLGDKSKEYEKDYEDKQKTQKSDAPKFRVYSNLYNFMATAVSLFTYLTKIAKWAAATFITLAALPFIGIVHRVLKKEKNRLLAESNQLLVQEIEGGAKLGVSPPELKKPRSLEQALQQSLTRQEETSLSDTVIKPIKVEERFHKEQDGSESLEFTLWQGMDSRSLPGSPNGTSYSRISYRLAFFRRWEGTEDFLLEPKDYEPDQSSVIVGVVDPADQQNKKALQALYASNRFRFAETVECYPKVFEPYGAILRPEEERLSETMKLIKK
jgi:hypothetical protein